MGRAGILCFFRSLWYAESSAVLLGIGSPSAKERLSEFKSDSVVGSFLEAAKIIFSAMVIGTGIISKTREDYNKIARHFSATRNRPWPEFDEFTPYLKNGQRILDWGCGNGRLLGSLANWDIEYHGIDQSDELIKIGRRLHTTQIADGKAHFYCTAKRDKKFPQNYFDVVFMIASLFHLPDAESRIKLLKKTYAELKPGGRLIILVWNLGSDWAKAEAKKGWQKIGDHDFLIPWKNPQGEVEVMRYYHHFTPEELTGILTEAGFSVESTRYSSGTWSDDKGGRNLIVIASKK